MFGFSRKKAAKNEKSAKLPSLEDFIRGNENIEYTDAYGRKFTIADKLAAKNLATLRTTSVEIKRYLAAITQLADLYQKIEKSPFKLHRKDIKAFHLEPRLDSEIDKDKTGDEKYETENKKIFCKCVLYIHLKLLELQKQKEDNGKIQSTGSAKTKKPTSYPELLNLNTNDHHFGRILMMLAEGAYTQSPEFFKEEIDQIPNIISIKEEETIDAPHKHGIQIPNEYPLQTHANTISEDSHGFFKRLFQATGVSIQAITTAEEKVELIPDNIYEKFGKPENWANLPKNLFDQYLKPVFDYYKERAERHNEFAEFLPAGTIKLMNKAYQQEETDFTEIINFLKDPIFKDKSNMVEIYLTLLHRNIFNKFLVSIKTIKPFETAEKNIVRQAESKKHSDIKPSVIRPVDIASLFKKHADIKQEMLTIAQKMEELLAETKSAVYQIPGFYSKVQNELAIADTEAKTALGQLSEMATNAGKKIKRTAVAIGHQFNIESEKIKQQRLLYQDIEKLNTLEDVVIRLEEEFKKYYLEYYAAHYIEDTTKITKESFVDDVLNNWQKKPKDHHYARSIALLLLSIIEQWPCELPHKFQHLTKTPENLPYIYRIKLPPNYTTAAKTAAEDTIDVANNEYQTAVSKAAEAKEYLTKNQNPSTQQASEQAEQAARKAQITYTEVITKMTGAKSVLALKQIFDKVAFPPDIVSATYKSTKNWTKANQFMEETTKFSFTKTHVWPLIAQHKARYQKMQSHYNLLPDKSTEEAMKIFEKIQQILKAEQKFFENIYALIENLVSNDKVFDNPVFKSTVLLHNFPLDNLKNLYWQFIFEFIPETFKEFNQKFHGYANLSQEKSVIDFDKEADDIFEILMKKPIIRMERIKLAYELDFAVSQIPDFYKALPARKGDDKDRRIHQQQTEQFFHKWTIARTDEKLPEKEQIVSLEDRIKWITRELMNVCGETHLATAAVKNNSDKILKALQNVIALQISPQHTPQPGEDYIRSLAILLRHAIKNQPEDAIKYIQDEAAAGGFPKEQASNLTALIQKAMPTEQYIISARLSNKNPNQGDKPLIVLATLFAEYITEKQEDEKESWTSIPIRERH